MTICRLLSLLFLSLLLVLSPVSGGRTLAAGGRTPVPFAPDDDLAAIRLKIKRNGYHFTVASNWVFELPPAQRARMRSRHAPAEILSRAEVSAADPGPVTAFIGEVLPSHFDWRDRNGRSYIGPIRSQGSCGSCYAFGACAAAEGSYNLVVGLHDADCIDFSEAFISFCLDDFFDGFDSCVGSDYDYQELDALVEFGVCREKVFPYDPQVRECWLPSFPETVRFRAWYRLPCGDLDMIKAAIYHFGVVDAAVLTNRAFDAYRSGIYEDSNSDCESDPCFYAATDHVVALVGWDDNQGEGYWILRNSWGVSWGEKGYMRISYRAAHVACAVCYLLPEKAPAASLPGITSWLPLLLGR